MEETTPTITTRAAGVRYGLILSLISIIYFLVMSMMNINMVEGPARWLSLVFTAVLIFLAHKYYKDNGDSYMSYGQGVGIAFWTTLVSTVIYSIFFYVYVKFVDSSFMDMIREQQIEQMEARGMSDEQIEQAMKFAEAFTSPEALLGFGIFGGVLGGVIIGLIVTIFTQNKRPEMGM
jgi:ABC-type dipeptide/oligopeptide/nickel transport system permease component